MSYRRTWLEEERLIREELSMGLVLYYKSESESISHSVVPNSFDPLAVACQALLSMEFSRHEYWSG